MDMLFTSFFWVTLGQIMMINILLSGDNAVVIALASRNLPPKQQRQAILFGSFGAIVLRVILTFFAVVLLAFPYLKIIGGILLVWIAIKMLLPEGDGEELDGHTGLPAAIKTIVVADFVMSLDNVLGVAAAAKGNTVLLVTGLAISIPLIIYGSTLVLKLMERFGFIVVLGAGLLGWVAGEMLVTDPAVADWIETQAHWAHTAIPVLGAAIVVITGTWLSRVHQAQPVPVAVPADQPSVEHSAGPEHVPAAMAAAFAPVAESVVPPFEAAPRHMGGELRRQGVAASDAAADDLPIGYRHVASQWKTWPDGHRTYAALEGKDAYHRIAPVSGRVHDRHGRSYLGGGD